MKSIFSLSFATVTLFAALAIPVRLAAQEQIRYTVTDLGTLGGTFSTAQGISEDGWVEGWSLLPGDQTQRSFLWVGGFQTTACVFELGSAPGSAPVPSAGYRCKWARLRL
jgi:hypothetical protein